MVVISVLFTNRAQLVTKAWSVKSETKAILVHLENKVLPGKLGEPGLKGLRENPERMGYP